MSVLLMKITTIHKVSFRSNSTIHQTDGIDCAELAHYFRRKGVTYEPPEHQSPHLVSAIEQVKLGCRNHSRKIR